LRLLRGARRFPFTAAVNGSVSKKTFLPDTFKYSEISSVLRFFDEMVIQSHEP